jgi:hypothetical protein
MTSSNENEKKSFDEESKELRKTIDDLEKIANEQKTEESLSNANEIHVAESVNDLEIDDNILNSEKETLNKSKIISSNKEIPFVGEGILKSAYNYFSNSISNLFIQKKGYLEQSLDNETDVTPFEEKNKKSTVDDYKDLKPPENVLKPLPSLDYGPTFFQKYKKEINLGVALSIIATGIFVPSYYFFGSQEKRNNIKLGIENKYDRGVKNISNVIRDIKGDQVSEVEIVPVEDKNMDEIVAFDDKVIKVPSISSIDEKKINSDVNSVGDRKKPVNKYNTKKEISSITDVKVKPKKVQPRKDKFVKKTEQKIKPDVKTSQSFTDIIQSYQKNINILTTENIGYNKFIKNEKKMYADASLILGYNMDDEKKEISKLENKISKLKFQHDNKITGLNKKAYNVQIDLVKYLLTFKNKEVSKEVKLSDQDQIKFDVIKMFKNLETDEEVFDEMSKMPGMSDIKEKYQAVKEQTIYSESDYIVDGKINQFKVNELEKTLSENFKINSSKYYNQLGKLTNEKKGLLSNYSKNTKSLKMNLNELNGVYKEKENKIFEEKNKIKKQYLNFIEINKVNINNLEEKIEKSYSIKNN